MKTVVNVPRRRPVRAHRLILLTVFLGLSPGSRAAAQQQADSGIPPSLATQINALMAEKASRTPAQQKMDSQLIYALKMGQGQPLAAAVPALQVVLPYRSDARLELDVRANVNDALLGQLRGLGAEILESNATYRDVRLLAALSQVESIAALPEVIFVGPKQEGIVGGAGSPLSPPFAGAERVRALKRRKRIERAALSAKVQRALSGQDALTNGVNLYTEVGSVTSQGDATHKASTARLNYTVDGTGIKVGVLSDGVVSLAMAQSTGDLDYVTVVPGQTGTGDEGTAILEIIHDLASGAQLYFATGLTSTTSFANNIRTLRVTYGCDIIIDDIGYFAESPFQDGQAGTVISTTNGGVVTQAVKDVVAAGALYFSSAGNSGNLDAGTSGTWEGNFVPGAINALLCATCPAHNFGALNYDVMMIGSSKPISLFWSDPLGASANDYDLYRTNSAGTVVLAASTNTQNGTQDPFEIIGGIANATDRIYIVKSSGSARFLHLDTNGGRLSLATAGNIHGHAATSGANSFGVAATPAELDDGFGGTNGPYPGSFNSSNKVEPFSSDGPRRIFFNADSTAITPGDFSATGGQLLNKPDIIAADGVLVSGAGGFGAPRSQCSPTAGRGSCFFGTSAAASHAGAIAALVKSANPSLPATQIAAMLLNSAIDTPAAGWDRDSGSGIMMADSALSGMPNCGTFAPAFNYGAGSGPASVAIGDLNRDGRPDLAVANYASSNVSVLLGNGDGTFGLASNYGVAVGSGAGPISLAIGDLNGDGKPDLAIASWTCGPCVGGPGDVSILLGNGDGTFAPPLNYSAGQYATSLAIGDLNGDGKPDLALTTANRDGSSFISILLGNGDGTFAPPLNYGLGSASQSVAIADLNHDGKPDLAVANGSNVSILLGNGDGTFAPAMNYGLGANSSPFSVAIGDLNGNGKPDLAVANDPSNVSILLNTCTAPQPDLVVTKAHTGNFTQGTTGASYTIVVSNAGSAPTNGTVTVTDTLPAGLMATAMSGSQWSCALGTLTCGRTDALSASASYPPITLTVNVASNAASTVINTVTVSGGGEIITANDKARDPTTVNLSLVCQFTDDPIIARATVIKAIHFAELRNCIDSVRAIYGLGSYSSYSQSVTVGAIIRAADIIEMRQALGEAYKAANAQGKSLPLPTYTTNPSPGSIIVVADIVDLRSAVLYLETH